MPRDSVTIAHCIKTHGSRLCPVRLRRQGQLHAVRLRGTQGCAIRIHHDRFLPQWIVDLLSRRSVRQPGINSRIRTARCCTAIFDNGQTLGLELICAVRPCGRGGGPPASGCRRRSSMKLDYHALSSSFVRLRQLLTGTRARSCIADCM